MSKSDEPSGPMPPDLDSLAVAGGFALLGAATMLSVGSSALFGGAAGLLGMGAIYLVGPLQCLLLALPLAGWLLVLNAWRTAGWLSDQAAQRLVFVGVLVTFVGKGGLYLATAPYDSEQFGWMFFILGADGPVLLFFAMALMVVLGSRQK